MAHVGKVSHILDRVSLSQTCRTMQFALRALVDLDRQLALESMPALHSPNDTGSAWLTMLRGSHIHLKSTVIGRALTKTDMTVLVYLLRRPLAPEGVSWRKIEELVLEYPCGVDDGAAELLSQALPSLAPTLGVLSMSGCSLGDAGALSLAEVVASGRLRRLQSVQVEDNPFSPAARAVLRRACRKHNVALSAYTEIENESGMAIF